MCSDIFLTSLKERDNDRVSSCFPSTHGTLLLTEGLTGPWEQAYKSLQKKNRRKSAEKERI